jgi:hypothetical protein
MFNVENFTTLQKGALASEGSVMTCPRCARTGIERHDEDGRPFFLHAQSTEVLGDGIVTQALDFCALPIGMPFDVRGEGVI